jgi:hypothetical protein
VPFTDLSLDDEKTVVSTSDAIDIPGSFEDHGVFSPPVNSPGGLPAVLVVDNFVGKTVLCPSNSFIDEISQLRDQSHDALDDSLQVEEEDEEISDTCCFVRSSSLRQTLRGKRRFLPSHLSGGAGAGTLAEDVVCRIIEDLLDALIGVEEERFIPEEDEHIELSKGAVGENYFNLTMDFDVVDAHKSTPNKPDESWVHDSFMTVLCSPCPLPDPNVTILDTSDVFLHPVKPSSSMRPAITSIHLGIPAGGEHIPDGDISAASPSLALHLPPTLDRPGVTDRPSLLSGAGLFMVNKHRKVSLEEMENNPRKSRISLISPAPYRASPPTGQQSEQETALLKEYTERAKQVLLASAVFSGRSVLYCVISCIVQKFVLLFVLFLYFFASAFLSHFVTFFCCTLIIFFFIKT